MGCHLSVKKESAAIQKLANVTLTCREGSAPSAMRSMPDFDLVLELPEAQLDAQRKRKEERRASCAQQTGAAARSG